MLVADTLNLQVFPSVSPVTTVDGVVRVLDRVNVDPDPPLVQTEQLATVANPLSGLELTAVHVRFTDVEDGEVAARSVGELGLDYARIPEVLGSDAVEYPLALYASTVALIVSPIV